MSFRHITRGGWITLMLTVVWAACVLSLLCGVRSSFCEAAWIWMQFPLVMMEGSRLLGHTRGVVSLEGMFLHHLWMIPNLFILGYGIAGILRAGHLIFGISCRKNGGKIPR
ncbi:MAG: hypothetical protein EOP88_07720 [Verrucomicrobiaceae bacterium]|nr:MAG: hypothetical protein EOP88_07720 [Verrucomicrobiaceae bacterium]